MQIGSLERLKSLGYSIENVVRKDDVIKFDFVSPGSATLRPEGREITNSFSHLILADSLEEIEPAWANKGFRGSRLNLAFEKEDSGKFRSEIQIASEDWKDSFLIVKFFGDTDGNPMIYYFHVSKLLTIIESIESEKEGG